MLTQLATVKQRLEISASTYDDVLTRAIEAISARFDRECNRTLARTVNATQEFAALSTEVMAECYPIESVSKFELKTTEAEGWVEQTGINYLVRSACVISLILPLSFVPASVAQQRARVTYTGGYVSPGTTPSAGQAALPDDVEWAAVEQIAAWFQQRDKLGLLRYWPSGGTFLAFAQDPLLPQVAAIVGRFRRWTI